MKKISFVLVVSCFTFLTANSEVKTQDIKEEVMVVKENTIIKKKENNLKAEIEKLKKILLAERNNN